MLISRVHYSDDGDDGENGWHLLLKFDEHKISQITHHLIILSLTA